VQTHIGIQGQAAVSSAYLYENGGVSHGAHQKWGHQVYIAVQTALHSKTISLRYSAAHKTAGSAAHLAQWGILRVRRKCEPLYLI